MLGLLYADSKKARAIKSWDTRISNQYVYMKLNELDETGMNYLDVDKLLDSYMDEFYEARMQKQDELKLDFENMMRDCRRLSRKINIKDIIRVFVSDKELNKSPVLHLKFADNFTMIRTFIYSLVCGLNQAEVTTEQFMAACNRFGVDSPLPIITKRISLYGNNEDLTKEFQKLVDRFKAIEPQINVDPDLLTCNEVKDNQIGEFLNDKNKTMFDFKETSQLSPQKKPSIIQNITLLSATQTKFNLGQSSIDSIESPNKSLVKDYKIAGIKMSIHDIKTIEEGNPNTVKPLTEVQQQDFKQMKAIRMLGTPAKPSKVEEMRKVPQSPQVVGGISAQAYLLHDQHKYDKTVEELGVSNKKIIIPSFSTTSKLLTQHFHVLRELRYRVDLLKKAYDDQRAQDRSWEQITEIRKVLSNAMHYLDFPSEEELRRRMAKEDELSRGDLSSPSKYEKKKTMLDLIKSNRVIKQRSNLNLKPKISDIIEEEQLRE